MSCIRKAEVGMFGLLVQERKGVALVVGDEAQAGSEKSPASLDQEGMSQDQGMCMLVAIVLRAVLLQATNGTDIELGQPGTDQCQVVPCPPQEFTAFWSNFSTRLAVAQVLVGPRHAGPRQPTRVRSCSAMPSGPPQRTVTPNGQRAC